MVSPHCTLSQQRRKNAFHHVPLLEHFPTDLQHPLEVRAPSPANGQHSCGIWQQKSTDSGAASQTEVCFFPIFRAMEVPSFGNSGDLTEYKPLAEPMRAGALSKRDTNSDPCPRGISNFLPRTLGGT